MLLTEARIGQEVKRLPAYSVLASQASWLSMTVQGLQHPRSQQGERGGEGKAPSFWNVSEAPEAVF